MDSSGNVFTRITGRVLRQIEGSIYWAFLAWLSSSLGVGAMLTALWSYIQRLRGAPRPDRLGLFILASMISCIVLLVWLIVRPKTTTSEISEMPNGGHKETFPPRPVELGGEIRELLFGDGDTWGNYQVFMNIRITNTGQQKATVTKASLHVLVGEESQSGNPIVIDPLKRISKESDALFEFEKKEVHSDFAPRIDIDHVYETGVPHNGWLAFEVSAWGNSSYPYNARFLVQLEDSFGSDHWVEKPAAFYQQKGKVIKLEHAEVSTLKPLILPPL